MPEFTVITTLSDGTILGDPILSAQQWEQTERLDQAGTFRTRISALEERARWATGKRQMLCGVYLDGDQVLIGSGIIDERKISADGSGGIWVEVSGPDLLRELTYRHVGTLQLTNTAAGPTAILAFAPSGWSFNTTDGWDTTAENVTHDFEGETVLEALNILAQMTGEHFRISGTREILWLRSSTPSSGVVAVQDLDENPQDANVALITGLEIVEDSAEAYTRVYPYGAGDGDARLDLSGATYTPPSPYTIDTVNNVITNAVGESPARWPGVRIDAPPQHWKDITDANTLALAAYNWLREHGDGDQYASYRIRLSGCPTLLHPGETIRIIYQRYTTQEGVVGYIGSVVDAIDLDQDLLILEVTNRVDGNGITSTEILAATLDRWPTTDAEVILSGLGESVNSYTHTQPVDPGTITGTLDPAYYPDALLRDGSRSLIGNLTVSAGITLDGVDLSAHAADPAAHHTRFVGLKDNAGTTATPDGSALVQIAAGTGITSVQGTNKITVGIDYSASNPATLSVSSAAAPGSAAQPAHYDHVHAITTSSNPGALAAILASDSSGTLRLEGLAIGAALSPYLLRIYKNDAAVSTTTQLVSEELRTKQTGSGNFGTQTTGISHYLGSSAGVTNAYTQSALTVGLYINGTDYAGDLSLAAGLYIWQTVMSESSGTLGNYFGMAITLTNSGANTLAIGTYAGIKIYNPVLGSGESIDYAYGLAIDSITTGSLANYAIYTGAGRVLLQDYTGIYNSSAGQVTLTLKLASGQTQPLLRAYDYSWGVMAEIQYDGTLYGAAELQMAGTGSSYILGTLGLGHSSPAAGLHVVGISDVPVIIAKAYSSQTANLQEWQSTTGTVLAWVDKDGAADFESISVSSVSSDLIPSSNDTYDLGTSTLMWRKGWLSELDAVLFAINTKTLLGGWLTVGKDAGTLGADVAAADDQIDFGAARTPGEWVELRAAGKVEYIKIGSLVSGTTYWVDAAHDGDRDLDGSGANDWAAGTPYDVLGTPGDGRVELNAYDTPRIQVLVQGATATAKVEQIRLGDLDGNWGYSSPIFGMAVGEYASGLANLTWDPDNGLRLRIYNSNYIVLDNSGNAFIAGVLTIDTAGEIRQGTGTLGSNYTGIRIYQSSGVGLLKTYNANAEQIVLDTDGALKAGAGRIQLSRSGLWIYKDSGLTTQAFAVSATNGVSWGGFTLDEGDVLLGTSSGNYVRYDASAGTVTFAGNGAGITSINGGNIQTGTVTATQISVSSLAALTVTTGALNISGICTIGTSGEIRQGSGTLGSNFTGLRMWNSGGVGTLAGYNNNTIQVQIDTAGHLVGAGGAFYVDGSNVKLIHKSIHDDSAYLKWYLLDGTSNILKIVGDYGGGSTDYVGWIVAPMTSGNTNTIALLCATQGSNTQTVLYVANTGYSLELQKASTIFAVNTSGQIAVSKSTGAVVQKAANTTINSGAWTRLSQNSELYDSNSGTYVHNGTNSDRFYAPYSGLYIITLNVEWSYNAAGGRFIRIVNSSGTTIAISSKLPTNPDYQSLSVVTYLTAGQYIYCDAYQNSGSTIYIYGSNAPYGQVVGFARIA